MTLEKVQCATKAASTDERLLVAQAKSGCSSAFGELYEHHRLRIYHTAFRILRNRQDAEVLLNGRFSALSQSSIDFAKTRPS